MNLSQQIIDLLNDPQGLEMLYQNQSDDFRKSFPEAYQQYPDSLVLTVWQARLDQLDAAPAQYSTAGEISGLRASSRMEWLVVGLLSVMAGLSLRLIMVWAEPMKIAPANILYGIVPWLVVLFVYLNKPGKKLSMVLGAVTLLSAVYLNLLPLLQSDSIILTYLHLPVFLWVVVGLAFTGQDYQSSEARLKYLKFNGEFGILYASLAICGMILAFLTLQLFRFAGLNIEELYFENIVVFGASALAVVAAYLIRLNLKLAQHLAPYIARIFSPLILLTLAAYLTVVAWLGKNPFVDRDFLIAFNGILLVVLAVTIFTLTERKQSGNPGLFDYLNLALIVLALVTDGIALASILFRLAALGLTPNRLAVLGVNILIGVHLVWILLEMVRFLRGRHELLQVQQAVTRYLPVYGAWAAGVCLIFPWLFPA